MKCPDCKSNNITDANYCKKCCHNFTKEEQANAYKKTIFGKLDTIKEQFEKCTLQKIIGDIKFKILTIVLVLSVGVIKVINYGMELKILESDNYTIQYNNKEDEHYIISKDSNVTLNLYIPNQTEKIILTELSPENKSVNKQEFSITENITLNVTNADTYYSIEALYSNSKSEVIKLYVFQQDNLK